MPTYIVEYRSTGGGLRSRGEAYRNAQSARKEYRKRLGESLLMAGPKFLSSAGTEAISSIMVIEAEDLESAREIAAQDPYVEVGEFRDFSVNEIALTAFNSSYRLVR